MGIRSFDFMELFVMLYMADFLYRRAIEGKRLSCLMILVPIGICLYAGICL